MRSIPDFCAAALLALSVTVSVAQAAEYHLAPHGSDGNACTPSAPCRSFARARPLLQSGDTLYYRAGTYSEILQVDANALIPSGTPSAPTTIAGYPGETVVLTGGAGITIYGGAKLEHVVLRNFVLDGASLATQGCGWPLNRDCGPHFITHEDIEVKNTAITGIFGGYGATHLTYRRVRVHHCGSSRLDHGLYVGAPDMVIEDSEASDNSGAGFHVFDTGCPPDGAGERHCNDHVTLRNSRALRNRGEGAVVLSHGWHMCFSGNVVADNPGTGLGLGYGNPHHTKLLGNTFTDNGGGGIAIGADAVQTVVGGNSFRGNRGADVDDRGEGTTQMAQGSSAGDCPVTSAEAPPRKRPTPRNLRVVTGR